MVKNYAGQSAVFITCKSERPKFSTIADYKEYLAAELFQSVLNSRFFKISRQADEEESPFYSASVYTEEPVKPVQTFCLSATVEQGGTLPALTALLTEVARIRLWGVSEREARRDWT